MGANTCSKNINIVTLTKRSFLSIGHIIESDGMVSKDCVK